MELEAVSSVSLVSGSGNGHERPKVLLLFAVVLNSKSLPEPVLCYSPPAPGDKLVTQQKQWV
jgi:hypothetical protein